MIVIGPVGMFSSAQSYDMEGTTVATLYLSPVTTTDVFDFNKKYIY